MNFIDELSMFCLEGSARDCRPYGQGHINETYLVETDTGAKYIFQKINDRLFQSVAGLMNNIELVTEFLAKKLTALGKDSERETLTLVRTKEGAAYLAAATGNFRVYKFIDRATSHQSVVKPEYFYESARAFGRFQNLLADFDASLLYDVLPNFHNTAKRLDNFKKSLAENRSGRAHEVKEETEFVLSREKYCGKIVDMLAANAMPLKVTHNDTKLNNVMIDDETGKGVAVIDLDTVMKGSSVYDFGDSIRFGCNNAAEDEKDLSKVFFRLDLFEAYCKGYLSELKGSITAAERDNLAFGALLMTLECGMRFLGDHIDGDTYFKIHRPGHNLDRARTQFKLVAEMEKNMDAMNEIVNGMV